MKSPDAWVRPHIKALARYTPAREVHGREEGGEQLFLDANENPYGTLAPELGDDLHRYPDPECAELRTALSAWLEVEPERLWIGNGSDEAFDLLVRTFVDPGEPVVIATPTFEMYELAARAQGAQIRNVPLDSEFDLDVEGTARAAKGAKIVFLCSPNNPTGNRLSPERVERLARDLDCLIVLDEAYVEFSEDPSQIDLIREHRNLAITRTCSKAWGLAGARVGFMVADLDVVDYVDRVNLAYPLSASSAQAALLALKRVPEMQTIVDQIVAERARLSDELKRLGLHVYPSQANFVLFRVPEARTVYRRLADEFGIIVRDRSHLPRLENCLRVTVGRPKDTDELCAALEAILT